MATKWGDSAVDRPLRIGDGLPIIGLISTTSLTLSIVSRLRPGSTVKADSLGCPC